MAAAGDGVILAAFIIVGAVFCGALLLLILGACAAGAREDREHAELIAREHGQPKGNVDLLPRL